MDTVATKPTPTIEQLVKKLDMLDRCVGKTTLILEMQYAEISGLTGIVRSLQARLNQLEPKLQPSMRN